MSSVVDYVGEVFTSAMALFFVVAAWLFLMASRTRARHMTFSGFGVAIAVTLERRSIPRSDKEVKEDGIS